MDKKWCVYLHTVHADCGYDKYYVGITSQLPEKRWGYGHGYKRCPSFWNAIQKYGWNNIEHEILEINLCENEAKDMEQKLIKKYKSNIVKFGYNLTEGGDGTVGWCPTEEQKLHISESLKGDKNPNWGKPRSEETRKKIGLGNKGKMVTMETKQKMSQLKKRQIENKEVLPPMANKKHTSESKRKMSESKLGKNLGKDSGVSRTVYQYDLDGNYINSYEGSLEAERITGIGRSGINACCNNNRKSSGGYLWSYNKCEKIDKYIPYKKQGIPVYQYTKDGNILLNIFESATKASEMTGANKVNISKCCLGERKTCGGYVWKYS